MADEPHAASPSIMDRLANIEFRLHEIDEGKRRLSKEMGQLDSEASRLKKELGELEAARAKLRHGVDISDHALVRWLERHHGMDLEPYRREMASPALREAVAAGVEGLKTTHGTFKIKDGVVTTFVAGRGEPA